MSAKIPKKNKGTALGTSSLVLNVFFKNPNVPLNYKQVSKLLNIKDKSDREIVLRQLDNLVKDKNLIEDKIGRFKLNPEKHALYFPKKTKNPQKSCHFVSFRIMGVEGRSFGGRGRLFAYDEFLSELFILF